MSKYFILLTFLFSGPAMAYGWDDEDCGRKNAKEGKVFELNIGMSFHGSFGFKLCKKLDKESLVIFSKNKSNELSNEPNKKTIELTKKQSEILNNKCIAALKYNTLDDSTGLDGSSWCIESQRGFTYTKACFWAPGSNTEKRGLIGLHDLGTHLWEISGLKAQGIRLY